MREVDDEPPRQHIKCEARIPKMSANEARGTHMLSCTQCKWLLWLLGCLKQKNNVDVSISTKHASYTARALHAHLR